MKSNEARGASLPWTVEETKMVVLCFGLLKEREGCFFFSFLFSFPENVLVYGRC
jgi:hypothetical protein